MTLHVGAQEVNACVFLVCGAMLIALVFTTRHR
jgi:hypothetical protein